MRHTDSSNFFTARGGGAPVTEAVIVAVPVSVTVAAFLAVFVVVIVSPFVAVTSAVLWRK